MDIQCMFNSYNKLCVILFLILKNLSLNNNEEEIKEEINEVKWNILLTSGKEIKRDSLSNVNEIRKVLNK